MDQALSPEWLQRRRRRRLAGAAAVLLVLGAAAFGLNRLLQPGVPAESVLLTTVRVGSIAQTLSATGLVVPSREEQVTSPLPTRVGRVHVKPGEAVQAGQRLLTLDNQSAVLAAEALREQLAQSDNRRASLQQELQQKRRQIAAAIELLELDLQSAQVRWSRFQEHRDSGTVSKNDLMAAELAVQRLQIQVRQQRELLQDTEAATLRSLQAAALQQSIQRKQLEQQLRLIAQTEVRAPFSGVLTALVTDEGASVSAGQMVAKVSELAHFAVEATMSDFHARALAAGQAVRVEQGGQTLTGRVQTVLPEIVDGTVRLRVTLDQPDHPMLRHRLRVDVRVVTERRERTLVADQGPAFNGRGLQPVFVVHDGVARRTMLELGASDGHLVEIVAGAQEGDRIVRSRIPEALQRDTLRITP
jgi:HlyD family secretion protein